MAQKILLADDDTDLAEGLSWYLAAAGFQVVQAKDGREALERFAAEKPDLVILDVMMPLADGVLVCQELRNQSTVPILMLSARDGELDKVKALDRGADDYVTKPFSVVEVVSRIRALLRRSAPTPVDRASYVWNGLELFASEHRARFGGVDIPLTNLEFSVLLLLMGTPRQVFTRQRLIDEVWGGGEEYHLGGRQVDNLVYRLREKLGDAGLGAFPIATIRGVGYAFRPEG